MKKLIVVCVVLLVVWLVPTVSANELTTEDIYSQQFEQSGAEELSEALPDDVRQQMDELDISGLDTSWTEELTVENIFGQILSFLKSGGKRPLLAGVSILAVLLFGSAAGGLMHENRNIEYVVTLGITASAVLPAVSTVMASVSAIRSAGTFMLAFIPVFAAILISRGRSLTAAGYSSLMLGASEAVTSLCSLVITPLVGMQLGLTVSGSVLTEINTASVGRTVRRIANWILTLCTTVLLAVLGIQTLINGSADSLSDKTAKFIIGSTVPVVGGAVGEALATVKGCLKLLGSSVAIYGIIAVAMLMLPVIVELLLWRVVLLLTAMIAELLIKERSAMLLRSVDSAVAFVLGITVFIGVLFVISITVVSLV